LHKACCPAPKCEVKSCDACDSCGLMDRIRGMFHRDSCCETKPACDACDSCGHRWSLSRLFGGHGGCDACCGAVESTAPAPSPAPAPAPAPAPRPAAAGARNNGLLILTPAG
jgi:hypothetical protein